MKNRKILFTVVFLLMICLCLISSNVYATSSVSRSFRLTLKAGKTVVNPGDQIRIQMEVSNLNNVEQGLMAMIGQFEYNNNVLELVKIEGEQGWRFDDNSFNADSLKFVTDASNYVTAGDVITITVKVKDNAAIGTTTSLKVKNVKASNGSYVVTANDAEVSFSIEQKVINPDEFTISSDQYEIQDGNISYVLPRTTVGEFNRHITTNRTTHVVDASGVEQSAESLVKTGMKMTVDRENVEYTIIVIGDINCDGISDVADLARIKLHLIDKTILSGIEYRAGDIDRDKRISINDLAFLKLVLIGLKNF